MRKLLILFLSVFIGISMAQVARPDSDISAGSWSPYPASPTTLWDKIDEVTPNDDADYIVSSTDEDECELSLTDVTDPEVGTGHKIRCYAKSPVGAGAAEQITISLIENGNVRCEDGPHNVNRPAYALIEYTLSEAEANAITNYANLRFRIHINKTDADEPIRITQAEFECPSAVPPQTLIPDGIASLENFGTLKANFKMYPSVVASLEAFGTSQLNLRLLTQAVASQEGFGSARLNMRIFPQEIPCSVSVQISACDELTDWTSNGVESIDTEDKKEGTGSVKGTHASPLVNALYYIRYNPAGSWDWSVKEHVSFWFKCDRASTAFQYAQLEIIDTLGNWRSWSLTFSVGTWTAVKELLSTGDNQSATPPDLTLIDEVRVIFQADDAIGFYQKIDDMRVTDLMVGTPQLNFGISPSAIESLEAFGSANIAISQFLGVDAIISGEIFGDHTVKTGISLYPDSIESLEGFGTAKLNFRLLHSSIASLEGFGVASIVRSLSPSAIASLEGLGTAKLDLRLLMQAIASGEAFGTPNVSLEGGQTLYPDAIASLEGFGVAFVNLQQTVLPSGIVSVEIVQSPKLNLGIFPESVMSGETHGQTQLNLIIFPEAIESLEAFGFDSLYKLFPKLFKVAPRTRVFGVDARGRVFKVDPRKKIFDSDRRE